jgi:hypothetical protein
MAMVTNLPRVFFKLFAPILSNAVGEDRRSAAIDRYVYRVATFVLEPAQRLDLFVALSNHEVMTESLKLCVVRHVIQAVDNGISRHG